MSLDQLTPESISRHVDELLIQPQSMAENAGLFRIKSANEWLKDASLRPVPRQLLGEFWFEFEICIMFADTNVGKSIFGVQAGNAISSGVPIPGFPMLADKQKVLYLDFELSDKQFEGRYSQEYEDHYHFNENFLRAEIELPDIDSKEESTFERILIESIITAVQQSGAKILIIDNITYLSDQLEQSKGALPLMKLLKKIQRKFNLSILVLAHTPKRDQTRPLTRNDLAGSKMLINFCDSAFAIGESHKDPNLRYLKQVKVRSAEYKYTADNVCVCEIAKPNNFLQFQFLDFANEAEHLKQRSEDDVSERIYMAKEMSANGMSQRDIAKELGVAASSVNSYLKK